MHNSISTDSQSPLSASQLLSEPQILEHLKQCRNITRAFAYRELPTFWRSWCKTIGEHADNARSNKEQTALLDVQRLLQAVQQAAEHEFCQHLSNGFVKFKHKSLNTRTGEERFSGNILSLVEHSDLEETIAITSITHRADVLHGEALWVLQQRLALLNDGNKIDEPGNPVSPVQFCEALRKVLSSLEVDVKNKILGYKVFEESVIQGLDGLYKELNQYLIAQQLLPHLRFTGQTPASGSSPNSDERHLDRGDDDNSEELRVRQASNWLPNGTLAAGDAQHQDNLFHAIRNLQTYVAQQTLLQNPGSGATHEGINTVSTSLSSSAPVSVQDSYSGEHLVQVLQQLQTQTACLTQQATAANQSISDLKPLPIAEARQNILMEIAGTDQQGAVALADMQTIDLVGMLFEYMLSDEHLPDSVKALLSYLHTPFLKIAFIDKDFFEQQEHPARVLLNSLAEAGVRWVGNDGSEHHNIYSKIKTTVFRLLQEFKNDVRIFAELLLEFNGYTHNLARRQELMERRALEKVQGEEKLREAKMQVNEEVRRRIDGRELPSAVLLLLLQPWSDYLSFVLLRHGDQSETWRNGLGVIDDLLWSIQPKMSSADKKRQIAQIGPLLAALEKGFGTIGYDQAKGRKLIEVMAMLQKLALQSRQAEPAPAPMRSKLENMAAEKAGHGPVTDEPATPEEVKIVESLKMIEFGTWFEFAGGKRVKVAWYNKKTQHYMLVDQQGRRVSLSSGLELARRMISGRAKVIVGSSKPFFERALENIYRSLNEKIEVFRQTEVSPSPSGNRVKKTDSGRKQLDLEEDTYPKPDKPELRIAND